MEPAIRPSSPHRTRALGPAIRTRVWMQAQHLFSRGDSHPYCWLWWLHHDGRVGALQLPSHVLGCDELIPDLCRSGPGGAEGIALPRESIVAVALPRAPIVPLPRWKVSWGHPVQAGIRAFASLLDAAVLSALGALETAGAFFGSIENYNRLIMTTGQVRQHRLQALSLFPPLVAPLLLDLPGRPELFGNPGYQRTTGATSDDQRHRQTLEAIDRGRDLIGALAGYHGIDRSLVRSPLSRSTWPEGIIARRELHLLNALPAHARPSRPSDVQSRRHLLDALPLRLFEPHDTRRLVQSFRQGWNATWDALQHDFPALPNALRDCRDFLAAAIDQADPDAVAGARSRLALNLDPERLARAWIEQRGLRSLLAASRRWHEQPLQTRSDTDATADTTTLPALFGECRFPEGRAQELLSATALVDEGGHMHHCVADYWPEVLYEGIRLVHLESAGGEHGTAEYHLHDHGTGTAFVLVQLRGPCNAEPGPALTVLAERVQETLNTSDLEPARQWIVRERERFQTHRPRHRGGQTLRPLDTRSHRELGRLLAWCARQPSFDADASLHLTIAGFGHAEGPRLLHLLHVGDELSLQREPDNPYDARAVRVDWRHQKIGYLPRQHNAAVARLLDQGTPLAAHIASIRNHEGWAPLTVAIDLSCEQPPAT